MCAVTERRPKDGGANRCEPMRTDSANRFKCLILNQVTDVTDDFFLFRNKYKNIKKRARRSRVIPRNVAWFLSVSSVHRLHAKVFYQTNRHLNMQLTDDTRGELAALRMETEVLWPAKLEALFARCDELERELRGALLMLDQVDVEVQPWRPTDAMQFYRDRADLWATLDRLTARQKQA